MQVLPGTVLKTESISVGFSKISPSIEATGGLTLAQVCAITGLEPSTIQNWIKRGWVAHPVKKRYGEYQTARIMIINMLRSSMLLDNIALVLRYVNGEADNRGDDTIPDSILYTRLCIIIEECEKNRLMKPDDVRKAVDKSIRDISEKEVVSKEKLAKALTVMTLGFLASELTKQTDILFYDL